MLTSSAASQYAVEIKDASKTFGETNALTCLSVQVPWGSVFGLVGQKGAGKSTSLRTLAGLVAIDAGEAWVAGISLNENVALARQHVGYMPEHFGRYGHLSVYEYLEFYGASFGIRRQAKDQLYHDLLDLVDLLDKRDAAVDSLSPGGKQRLSLARCLIHDPDVLLLDEPVRDMDPWESEELSTIVQELSRLDKTVVFATEKLEDAKSVCDEVAVLEKGRLTERRTIQPRALPQEVARLELRLLNPGDLEIAARILSESPWSFDVKVVGERNLSAAFSGSEEDAPNVLETMREAGVWVTGFALKNSTSEAPAGLRDPAVDRELREEEAEPHS